MRKTLLTVLILLLIAFTVTAEDTKVILEKADAIFTADNIYQESSMVIYSNGEPGVEQVMESYYLEAGGKSYSLSVFTAPKRIAGTAYLSIGNDLWVRFASTGRTRKLSSSAKQSSAGGSDFSYADMGEGNNGFAADYDSSTITDATIDGRSCYKITLTPKRSDAVYDSAICYITKESYEYLRIEMYKSGAHIKTMILEDYRAIGGKSYPYSISMKSEIKDSKTVITTNEIAFDSKKVQKRYFSKSYLESLK